MQVPSEPGHQINLQGCMYCSSLALRSKWANCVGQLPRFTNTVSLLPIRVNAPFVVNLSVQSAKVVPFTAPTVLHGGSAGECMCSVVSNADMIR